MDNPSGDGHSSIAADSEVIYIQPVELGSISLNCPTSLVVFLAMKGKMERQLIGTQIIVIF